MRTGQPIPLWKGLEVQFRGLADIADRFFNCRSLRLATFEFGAPCVATLFILLNHDAHSSQHALSLSRLRLGSSV